MNHRFGIHHAIFAASGSATAAAVWGYLQTVSWTSAASVLISGAGTLWQLYLMRRKQLVAERIAEADRQADAEIAREARRREGAREQARLDAEARLSLQELAGKPRRRRRTRKPAPPADNPEGRV